MPNIQIKNVPDEQHRILRKRAGAAGKSLQEFMLGEIERITSKPTMEELFERVAARTGGTNAEFGDTAALIREIRQEREDHLMDVFEDSYARPQGKRRGG